MKTCTLLLICILSALNLYGLERHLTLEVEPIDTSDIINRHVWDFSKGKIHGNYKGAEIILHGDTLLSESMGRFRQWYFIKDTSIFYAGEETPERIVTPLYPTRWFSFPLQSGEQSTTTLQNHGRIYSRFDLAEDGMYSIETGTKGIVILPPGDTIYNVIITKEFRNVKEGIDNQTSFPLSEYDSLPEIHHTVFRWYLPSDTLPIALQIAREVRSFEGTVLSNATAAYIPDLLENNMDLSYLSPGIDVEHNIKSILSTLTVEYHDGNFVILFPGIQSYSDKSIIQNRFNVQTLNIDVMDIPGNLYKHAVTLLPEEGTINIPVSSLPAGKYVVGIRSEAYPEFTEKRFINIF